MSSYHMGSKGRTLAGNYRDKPDIQAQGQLPEKVRFQAQRPCLKRQLESRKSHRGGSPPCCRARRDLPGHGRLQPLTSKTFQQDTSGSGHRVIAWESRSDLRCGLQFLTLEGRVPSHRGQCGLSDAMEFFDGVSTSENSLSVIIGSRGENVYHRLLIDFWESLLPQFIRTCFRNIFTCSFVALSHLQYLRCIFEVYLILGVYLSLTLLRVRALTRGSHCGASFLQAPEPKACLERKGIQKNSSRIYCPGHWKGFIKYKK